MRNYLVNYLNELNQNIWFLHCDVFDCKNFSNNINVLNLGILESSIGNIAAGISKQNKVFIYSLCNYITHKGFESLYYNLTNWGNGALFFIARQSDLHIIKIYIIVIICLMILIF